MEQTMERFSNLLQQAQEHGLLTTEQLLQLLIQVVELRCSIKPPIFQ